jgi:hypothetical protein
LILDMPLEFPDGTTSVLARMYIYYGADHWRQAIPPPIPTNTGQHTSSLYEKQSFVKLVLQVN